MLQVFSHCVPWLHLEAFSLPLLLIATTSFILKLQCLEEALLAIISGFDEGFAQGIPWETLPLIRSFVKERLALAAFLNCLCSSRSIVGTLRRSTSGLATNEILSGQPLFEGNTLNFGCNCSGWKEGSIGMLSFHGRKYYDTLQQEISTLISVFNNLPSRYSMFCSGQVYDFSVSVKAMLNRFSSLNLASFSSGQD